MENVETKSESSFDVSERSLEEVALGSIVLPPELLRQHVDEEKLESLRKSIASRGVLVPLVVVRQGQSFRLVAGLRRYIAASAVGLASVPCLVVKSSAEWESWAMFAENAEREGVNPIDEAVWLTGRMGALGVGQRELARILDVSESWVSQRLSVFGWPDDIREAVSVEAISFSVGRELAGITDAGVRAMCLDTARRCGCSVRQASLWRRNWLAGQGGGSAVLGEGDEGPKGPGVPLVRVCVVCADECSGDEGLLTFCCSRCLAALEAARSSVGASTSPVSDVPP